MSTESRSTRIVVPRVISPQTHEEWVDSEIERLTALRDGVRESIEAAEEDNVESTSFEGREISHLPINVLHDHESEYTIQINQFITGKQGVDYLFGQFVKTKQC